MLARLEAARAAARCCATSAALDAATGKATVGLVELERVAPVREHQPHRQRRAASRRALHQNPLVVQGPGAGPAVTAGGVFADLLRALTRAYLDRIAAVDDSGPQLNAVIDINPAALKDADARDAERRAGRTRGPLHGIPILVKDNIDVAGMINSAGSLAFVDNRPASDASIIRRLRDAGVVILGRTNPERVGELPLDAVDVRVELARRANEERPRP